MNREDAKRIEEAAHEVAIHLARYMRTDEDYVLWKAAHNVSDLAASMACPWTWPQHVMDLVPVNK